MMSAIYLTIVVCLLASYDYCESRSVKIIIYVSIAAVLGSRQAKHITNVVALDVGEARAAHCAPVAINVGIACVL